jgi:hypothetical protein
MNMINQLIRFLIKLIFGIGESDAVEYLLNEKSVKEKYDSLVRMVDKGNINEAENYLYESMNVKNIGDLKVGLMFYNYLNTLSDERLAEADFSREEIKEGLKTISKLFGYENVTEQFF